MKLDPYSQNSSKWLVMQTNATTLWPGGRGEGPGSHYAFTGRWRRITLIHTQPGNPQQNAYVERYNRTVRYDWLAQNLFGSLEEVQQGATEWLWTYNNERPHKSLGGLTPVQKRNPHLLTRSTIAYC